jgi:5,5'-dehydrodivanillate O-demethylase
MGKYDGIDFVHTGPGTLAARYLRLFWQPVCRAQDLPLGRAVPVRITGENFTLFRGESGTPHLVAYRCAHRGTPLSVGWVEGDCIRCLYHGWRFDAAGQCVEQPGEHETFAAKVRIHSYPTREYLGLIFAYLGDGPPAPFRRYPDFEREGVLEVDEPEVWPCNFFNRLDNACDLAHVAWAHRETALRMNQPQTLVVPKISATETDFGIRTTVRYPGRPSRNFLFHMPNTNQFRVRAKVPEYKDQQLPEDRLIWFVPIDDEHCMTFDVNLAAGLTGHTGDAYRQARREAQGEETDSPYHAAEAVLAGKRTVRDADDGLSYYKQFWIEDYVTQVGQGVIANRSEERLGRMDVGTILTRRLWQRELKRLADGEPLTPWTSPTGLADMCWDSE